MSADTNNVDLNAVLNLQVPMVVILSEKKLNMEDVMSFSPGAIIEFSKESDQMLDVFINDTYIGKGEVVKVGEKFGVQLKEIGSTADKIKALGNR